MTPQEKTLIEGVFDRLTQSGVGTKDTQADLLIRERARALPDATYGLVQAVVMLEAGLNQAQAQIEDLRTQLAASRNSSTAGGFLPNAGPWAAAAGQRPVAPSAMAPSPSQPMAPPMMSQGSGPWTQSASPVGGFLRNAATMAAGVAGGTLIAEGLSSLFGGRGYGGGFGAPFGGGFGGGGFGGGGVVENVTVNNYYDDAAAAPAQDAGYQDTAYQDASYDDSAASDDGGFDDGGSFDDGSI